jgi:hypothetical protein
MNPELSIVEFLKNIVDPNNWGYVDDSGCARGAGEYTDQYIGDLDLIEAAKILLQKLEN